MRTDFALIISVAGLLGSATSTTAVVPDKDEQSSLSARIAPQDRGSQKDGWMGGEGSSTYSGLSEEGAPGSDHPEIAKGLDLRMSMGEHRK